MKSAVVQISYTTPTWRLCEPLVLPINPHGCSVTYVYVACLSHFYQVINLLFHVLCRTAELDKVLVIPAGIPVLLEVSCILNIAASYNYTGGKNTPT